MKAYFKRLYSYNQWANETLLPTLESQDAFSVDKVQKLLSHYLAAQEIWISRIQNRTPTIGGVWELYDMSRCVALASQTAADWLSFIDTIQESDYTRIIAYKNTQGNYYETPVIDIMAHCVNHANYHRAQIASLMRAAGKEPINTDFITYARLVALPE